MTSQKIKLSYNFLNLKNSVKLNKKISNLLEYQKTTITLDLIDLIFINSDGIWTLLELDHKLKSQGGKLQLMNVNETIKSYFKEMNIINKLNILELSYSFRKF